MAKSTAKKGAKAKSCRECARWKEAQERIRVVESLEKAIAKMDERIQSGEFSPSFAEYLKLVQLEKEYLQQEGDLKEITVTWVEPETASKE